MTVRENTSVEIVVQSGIFDRDYYAQQAGETFSTLEDAIADYLECGHLKKLNPHPLFDTSFYLDKYLDVAKAGVNPLLHYISQGAIENRNPSEHFDGYFYLSENPDVKALRGNPLSHFLLVGAAQGRKPSAVFDTTFYTIENPEIKESNINPLVHYVTRGKSEGRRTNSRPVYPRDLYLKMRQLEPLLPQFETLQSLRESKESFVSKPGFVYNRLMGKITQKFSHLYVVSNQTSSLHNMRDFAKALSLRGQQNSALIIISGTLLEDANSLAGTIGSSNAIFSLQDFGKKLEPEEELQIIVRLAIQAEPQVIHAFGSRVCLDLFKRLHKPLSLRSKLFASVSEFDVDSEGITSGPNLYLSACADFLSAIFVKDQATRQQLIELIGFEKDVADRIVVCKNNEDASNQLNQLAYFGS